MSNNDLFTYLDRNQGKHKILIFTLFNQINYIMKRVSLVIALFIFSLIVLPSCEDKLQEIEVKTPTSDKMKDAENEHDGDPFGG